MTCKETRRLVVMGDAMGGKEMEGRALVGVAGGSFLLDATGRREAGLPRSPNKKDSPSFSLERFISSSSSLKTPNQHPF
jgi:hypothetical protein